MATPPDSPPTPAGHRSHRRSREEVEALAKSFIAPPVAVAPAPVRRRMALALAGGITLLVLLGVVFWPGSRPPAPRSPGDASAEAEQWRARFEAERERHRKDVQAGGDYLAKMAAAEAALLEEMGARASRLTAEPGSARRVPAENEPTPRDAPVAGENSATAAAPGPVATAPQCKLHVSQLSANGTLTFADVKGMKGARVDSAGNVLMPPVTLEDGRRVTFEVAPDGCMKWRRAG